jgi:uncharacterized protein YjbI with pentapeptide repeats
MIEPRRALVRPRVLSPITGEALLLEDVVGDEVRRGRGLPIQIVGGPGSGKTTALRHLQAVLPVSLELAGIELVFLDEPAPHEVDAHLPNIVVATSSDRSVVEAGSYAIRLAPWGEDDVVEYLLARHKSRCAEVLAQLRSCDRSELEGIPELWTLVLDALAENRAQPPLSQVLRAAILEKLDGPAIGAVGLHGLLCVLKDEVGAAKPAPQLGAHEVAAEVRALLRHVPMQHALAVGRIADDLAAGSPCHYLIAPLPRSVVRAVAERIRDDTAAAAHVRLLLTQPETRIHPMAASICHRLDRQWLRKYPTTHAHLAPNWLPIFPTTSATELPNLTRAYLDHADWPDLELPKAKLSKSDLSFANLAGTNLENATAVGTNFHGATLTKSDLRRIEAYGAVFAGADLREANGSNANFARADFRNARLDESAFLAVAFQGADFTGASLTGVRIKGSTFDEATFANADLTRADFASSKFARNDFRTARLDRTGWSRATLRECDFEEATAQQLDFEDADLTGCLWTGSTLTEAKFARANLTNAGLGEIEWEGADLRDADLRGATFHLGSSRSGLVGSPIAREGSMTGFYTDDFTEQEFKSPEEIRKASLRGADLRGAKIEGVDFYLVDLRDAKYDEEQAAHFRACRAILRTRGE